MPRVLPLPAPLKPYGERLLAALRDYAEEHTQEILSSVSKAGADFVSAAFSLVLVLISADPRLLLPQGRSADH
jgi:hypothetical protein